MKAASSEGELAVLDAALDHLLGDTDTSLFLGTEELTNLSFCLGTYDDREPSGAWVTAVER